MKKLDRLKVLPLFLFWLLRKLFWDSVHYRGSQNRTLNIMLFYAEYGIASCRQSKVYSHRFVAWFVEI